MGQIIQTSVRSEQKAPPYRTDLINAAMGAKRLTNEKVAEIASVNFKVVSAIRNGAPNVMLPSLIAVATALGLDMKDLFEPKEEISAAV
jgi:transcriptional regulator with XRE-family HTH domain